MRSIFGLILLAVACSCSVAMPKQGNVAIENIMSRTSVRAYTEQKISAEQIDTLLRAAMAAPTARNLQPWVFVVVDRRAILDSLSDVMPYGAMLLEAPLAVVVCADTIKAMEDIAGHNYWEQDCSAATQNMLLAANAIGLGGVWLGVFPSPDRVEPVRSVLNLPSHLIPLNIVSIGYPDQVLQPKDKYKADNIFYNKF